MASRFEIFQEDGKAGYRLLNDAPDGVFRVVHEVTWIPEEGDGPDVCREHRDRVIQAYKELPDGD